ncbi:MAG: hypothetical protein LBQ81_13150 [Zoogloeaceae bacterium]|jgi:hypothetical protein|nr:hypothetical protein [Zoogloeaceae bacterium]
MTGKLEDMGFKIIPFAGAGKLRFDMAIEEITDIVGPPEHVSMIMIFLKKQ